ncbi:hypothetical protein Tco_0668933 [Tanacetum coccineum]
MYELLQMMQSFCEKLLQQKQAANIDQSPLQEMSIQEMEDLKQHYLDEMLSLSNDLQIKDYRNEKIDIRFKRECENMIDEHKGKFNGMSIEINKKKELQRLEQVANLSTYPSQRFKSFCYDDDDDYDYEESSIPLRDIISKLPLSVAITPDLPTLKPEDSLIMGNEDFNTIPEKESDKGKDIKSILLLEKLLNNDPTSPLPPKELNFEELKVIKYDVSTDFEDDYYDSEGDIIYLESLLIKDTIHNLPPEVFLDHDPRSLKDELDKDDLKNIVKVFDPGIWGIIFSPTYVKLPFEDRHYLSLTYVIQIFLPYFTYPVKSSLPLSSGSEYIIFDPGISTFHFSSLEPVASHRSGTFMISPDFKDSRARGFVHRSLDLNSLACLYMGIRYPRSY